MRRRARTVEKSCKGSRGCTGTLVDKLADELDGELVELDDELADEVLDVRALRAEWVAW